MSEYSTPKIGENDLKRACFFSHFITKQQNIYRNACKYTPKSRQYNIHLYMIIIEAGTVLPQKLGLLFLFWMRHTCVNLHL